MHPPIALPSAPSSLPARSSRPEIHPGRLRDFRSLLSLEVACFENHRRDSSLSILAALASPLQEVWVVKSAALRVKGALFLRASRDGLRIYSLAVHSDFRREGLGRSLLDFAFERAGALNLQRVFLEAEAASPFLCKWYEEQGFSYGASLPDFYGQGHDAWRMVREMAPNLSSQ